MFIQVLIVIFIVYIVTKMIKKFRKKELGGKEFIYWFIFWMIFGIATILPKTTDTIANIVGVGRGYDLAVYISIIILFYLIFRMMVKIEELDKNLTKLVREMAIREERQEKL